MTPHTEPVQASPIPQERHLQTYDEHGMERTHESEDDVGAFEKILAGLLRKTGNRENVTDGVDGGAAGVKKPETPLAETAEMAPMVPLGETSQKNGIRPLSEDGAAETEFLNFSDQEKMLFTVDRLASQENHASKKGDDGSADLKANLLHTDGETVQMAVSQDASSLKNNELSKNTAFTEKTQSTEVHKVEKQSQTASTTAFAAEAAQISNAEKPQNRSGKALGGANAIDSTENNAKNGAAKTTSANIAGTNAASAGEAAREHQRNELKKTGMGEKDGRNRVEEARNRRRSVSFEVRDFRTGTAAGNTPVENINRNSAAPAKEITLELRLPNTGSESQAATTTATTSWEAKAGQALENMLARELHQNFNNDIVRHASIALRDSNEGTIRLALKPESLGNVKIHLELAENKIIGHIVVESEEALRAFQKELTSLEKAFRDSGFDVANLEMSLASDGKGAQQQWQETEASQFLAGQFVASRYDAALEQMEIPLTFDLYQQGSRAINLLA